MARRAVATHHKRLQAHHKRHKKHLLKLFHKVKSHPSCYKAGYFPKKGRVPKSLPRKPSGLNAKGSGLWDHVKKAWHWVTGQAKVAGKALLEEGKRRVTAYGKQALSQGSAWAKGQAQAVGQNMRNKVEGYVKRADAKIKSVADKVDSKLSKYTGGVGAMPGRTLKKGSGVSVKQRAARMAFLKKYVR